MNRALAFRDFTAWIVLRFPEVFLDNPHAFHQNTLLLRKHRQNPPRRTSEVPRDNLDVVAFFYVALEAIHKTSGASETIFMKLRSRNSRATGPKIRVPRGFKSLSMMTIALLSKRSRELSSRRIGCFVRTRTARTTSPFLTVPFALASFTLAVITSPIPAERVDLPITPIIVAMRAPLLSATSSLDRSCTIKLTIYSRIIRSYFWTTSTNRQRFSLLNGRVSIMRTMSPVFALFSSSCA